MAWAITGKKKYVGNYESYASHLRERGKSEEDIDTMFPAKESFAFILDK